MRLTTPTDPLAKSGASADSGASAYLHRPAVCATCGQLNRGLNGSYGAFHPDCARDERGRLLVREELAS